MSVILKGGVSDAQEVRRFFGPTNGYTPAWLPIPVKVRSQRLWRSVNEAKPLVLKFMASTPIDHSQVNETTGQEHAHPNTRHATKYEIYNSIAAPAK